MGGIGVIIFILAIIIAILLILVVLVQNPKGGGLDSAFGAANQLGSVQKTVDVIEKATWYLAGGLAVLAIVSTMFITKPQAAALDDDSKFNPSYQVTNTLPIK